MYRSLQRISKIKVFFIKVLFYFKFNLENRLEVGNPVLHGDVILGFDEARQSRQKIQFIKYCLSSFVWVLLKCSKINRLTRSNDFQR